MPGLDKTGPQGNGPMSGKTQGLCRPAGSASRREQFGGCGQGKGRRRGRGLRCGTGQGFGRRGAFGPNQTLPVDDE